MEGDLDKLAELIFNGETKKKGSVHITGDFDTVLDLFEALLMLFTKGMKILYAVDDQVPLSQITDKQFKYFIEKFGAIGVIPSVTKYHIYQQLELQGVEINQEIKDEWLETKNNYPDTIPLHTLRDYNQTHSESLEDYFFQFTSENNFYVINFKLELAS